MKNLKTFITCLIFSLFFSMTIVNAASKPSFNDVAICRIQLKVKTNTIKNANTNSSVWVQLNANDAPFFLNLSRNDREKGQLDTYDILSDNINKIGDIKMIKLGIKGGDGWNFKEMELIVNGISLYKKKFSSAGQWIDSNNKRHPKYFKVGIKELRNSPNWKYNSRTNYIYMAPKAIPVSMIKSFVESAVGNSLYNVKNISWGQKFGKEYVSAKRINANTLRFDLDLEYEITGMPDAEVDVDFDLVFSCDNGVIRTKITNYKSKASGVSKYLVKKLKTLKENMVASCNVLQVNKGIKACQNGLNKIDKWLDFNFNYDGPGGVNLSKSCKGSMKLDAKGNLYLGSGDKSITQRWKTKSGKIIDGTSNTVMVSRRRAKR